MASESNDIGKTSAELRTERVTWFGLVGVLIAAGIVPDWLALHNAFTPMCAGLVLVASGVYQNRQKWRVGFTTWVAATLMLVMAIYNIVDRPGPGFVFLLLSSWSQSSLP